MEPKVISYTRSHESNGSVKSYHLKDIANTIHSSTGSGGDTDQFVIVPSKWHIKKGGAGMPEYRKAAISQALTTCKYKQMFVVERASSHRSAPPKAGNSASKAQSDSATATSRQGLTDAATP